ncbi:hypothetical protein [Paraburkholderia sp.]|jgi:hypothetical protein|uniref:hypothetical protein n=1 Tax=Paraburkholderia sp. TaxID=1926495 RepID=UPI002F3F9F86
MKFRYSVHATVVEPALSTAPFTSPYAPSGDANTASPQASAADEAASFRRPAGRHHFALAQQLAGGAQKSAAS